MLFVGRSPMPSPLITRSGVQTAGLFLDLPLHGLIRFFALTIILFSGLVDLPRSVQIGPVTSQAFLTVGYYCAAILLVAMTPVLDAPVPWKTLPFGAFMFWASTSLLWSS